MKQRLIAGMIACWIWVGSGAVACCQDVYQGLRVSVAQKPDLKNVIAYYEGFDTGGNTSIAFDADNSYKWSGPSPHKADSFGYFTADNREISYIKRDRDLGQTFRLSGNEARTLSAIIVSTGYGTNAVRPGTYGQPISIQLFEVTGRPVLHDNGTDSTRQASHGFPHKPPIPHQRDDYYAGETYTSLGVFSGATFPTKEAFGVADTTRTVSPDHPKLKGRFLRFKLPANSAIRLQPGKQYAFLVLLNQQRANCGFTLANKYLGQYAAGHGIRRDGNGVFPPAPADPSKEFTHSANARALASAHFPADLRQRTAIAPGTNGYPDVDTWRDLQFYVEAK